MQLAQLLLCTLILDLLVFGIFPMTGKDGTTLYLALVMEEVAALTYILTLQRYYLPRMMIDRLEMPNERELSLFLLTRQYMLVSLAQPLQMLTSGSPQHRASSMMTGLLI